MSNSKMVYINSKNIRPLPETSAYHDKLVQISIPPVNDSVNLTHEQPYSDRWSNCLIPKDNVGPSVPDGQTKGGDDKFRTAVIIPDRVRLTPSMNKAEREANAAKEDSDPTKVKADEWVYAGNFKFINDFRSSNAKSLNKDSEYAKIIQNGGGLKEPSADSGKSAVKPYTCDVAIPGSSKSEKNPQGKLGTFSAWAANEKSAMKKIQNQSRIQNKIQEMEAEGQPVTINTGEMEQLPLVTPAKPKKEESKETTVEKAPQSQVMTQKETEVEEELPF